LISLSSSLLFSSYPFIPSSSFHFLLPPFSLPLHLLSSCSFPFYLLLAFLLFLLHLSSSFPCLFLVLYFPFFLHLVFPFPYISSLSTPLFLLITVPPLPSFPHASPQHKSALTVTGVARHIFLEVKGIYFQWLPMLMESETCLRICILTGAACKCDGFLTLEKLNASNVSINSVRAFQIEMRSFGL
jgi:hypothetical protein